MTDADRREREARIAALEARLARVRAVVEPWRGGSKEPVATLVHAILAALAADAGPEVKP